MKPETQNQLRKLVLERMNPGVPAGALPSPVDTLPITIGRLMAALYATRNYSRQDIGMLSELNSWKLLREDKTECDETDQTEEVGQALIKITK